MLETVAVEPLMGPKARGLNSLQTQLTSLLEEQQPNPGGESFADTAVCSALPVDHRRISVPPNVAQIQPQDHLSPSECREFLDHSARVVDPSPPAHDHPKPCYMVGNREEPALRNWLIEHEIAFPIPESKIARKDNG